MVALATLDRHHHLLVSWMSSAQTRLANGSSRASTARSWSSVVTSTAHDSSSRRLRLDEEEAKKQKEWEAICGGSRPTR
ncbi:hypothetical protein FOMPIDRAFT_1056745 [Fomitopsis schrenkii]|nr:hypothetical protein FOMPIDRAFT_1056745 [Fomitopsis schrenkii]